MLANFLKVGAPSDPNFENVTLLLHGDGTNGAQNNTFIDSSANNFTVTRNGDTTQGSFSPYGNLWSNYFDGTGDYLTAPDNNAFTFDADFTVEAWVYRATSGQQTIVAHWPGAVATNCSFALFVATSNYLSFAYGIGASNPTLTGTSAAVLLNQWNHVAVTRSGSTVRLFVNGVQDSTTGTVSGAFNNSTASLTVGVLNTTDGLYFNGYISNTRIVKGTALYTSNFTPSAIPLTAVSGTSLLTCQSNRFIDNSSNNFAITRNGDVSVQRFSPFEPSAAYSTSVIGGSGYFDGTGDYLTVAYNAALLLNGNFTLECWVYPTTASGVRTLINRSGQSNVQYSSYELLLQTDGKVTLQQGSGVGVTGTQAVLTTTATIPFGAWTHLAAVKSGSTNTIYINGISSASGASGTADQNTSALLSVGIRLLSNDQIFSGYLNGVRVVKGTAVYTANFTPPTAPLTAITNTSLLLNCVNAGIYDNAMMNDLVTVGNAQVSTSVKKYGTGSLAFDGNGDYLVALNNPLLDFGAGDFTIECWVYAVVGVSSYPRILSKGIFQGSGSWALGANFVNNSFSFEYGATPSYINFGTVGNFTSNTWHHVAIIRSGATLTAYLNGVAGTSATSSQNFTNTGLLYVGRASYASAPNTDVFQGYIDDLRITKGVARYTANFTPPTQAFPNT